MNSNSISRPRRGLLTSEPIILLALVLAGLYFAREVLIPLAMALTLNFLLAPLVIRFEKLRLRRVSAVILVLTLTTGIIGGVGWIVTRQVLSVVNDLPNYTDNIHDKMEQLHAPADGQVSQTLSSLRAISAAFTGQTPKPSASAAPAAPATPSMVHGSTRRARELAERKLEEEQEGKPVPVSVISPEETSRQYIAEYLSPMLHPLGTLGMVLIFTVYMLLKREDLRNRLLLLAGFGRLNLMTQALNDAAARISRFLVMNTLVNCGYGILFAGGLYLLRVPNATLWGALLAILRMVPYVGTMIVGTATLLYTLAIFTTWWHALWVFLLFAGMEIVIANFVEPYLYGSRTGISALALVAMAMVWTLLWGWAGLVVSTPLTVCLIVLGRYLPQMSFLHILLGDEAELAPEAKFYERLLATDQAEAHHIADRFLETHTLVDLYDEVVMPALTMTEQDRHKGVLDELRATYLFQSATELIAELTDYRAQANVDPICPPESIPARATPVVCIPANDHADEIAATMFAQLLEQCGHKTLMLPGAAVSTEILERLAEEPDTILCISALQPFAFAHARKLALRLREGLPANRILIGLWGAAGDKDALRERFGAGRPEVVVGKLRDGLEWVRGGNRTAHHWHKPAVIEQP
ncbi:AI-2E family transporter [Silvibacterium dinghuense]|uniref:AI-2E family transporter n=1 Tax=Silvibacterium dinghuense TaxID=1560006 RepID=A0A4Q1S8U9_9BACT|nr:AI-2E family transporter [Silvibacterium dinghuense]RXS93313.1 AI-2E family transporter [Silvibacterium dinghuense]GGH04823.1 ABC transporter permease [Silvibacterium dinghuense]